MWEAQPGAEVEGDAFVLPEYRGRGLGTLLLELMENRAPSSIAARRGPVTLGHLRVARQHGRSASCSNGAASESVHTVLRFKIDLANRSPEAGRAARGHRRCASTTPDDADAVRETMDEAFEGHRRYTPRRLDEWLDLRIRHPAFDPELWRVPSATGEVVGATLVYDVGETGYLSNVGVRRAWRGKGVAQALARRRVRGAPRAGPDAGDGLGRRRRRPGARSASTRRPGCGSTSATTGSSSPWTGRLSPEPAFWGSGEPLLLVLPVLRCLVATTKSRRRPPARARSAAPGRQGRRQEEAVPS